MSWRDRVKPGDPQPKPGETMRRYLLRRNRETDEENRQRLSDALADARERVPTMPGDER